MSTSYANIGFFISFDFRRDRIYLFFLEIALPRDFLDHDQVTHLIEISRGFIKRLKICLSNGQRVQNAFFFNKIRTSSSSSSKLRLLAQTADLGDCRMHDVIGFWGRILGIHFHVWATIYVKFDKRHFKSLNKRHWLLLKVILFCRSQMAL